MNAAKRSNKQEKDLIHRQLRSRIGEEKVKDDELTLVAYSSDVSPVQPQRPSVVVFPESRDDVAEVLKTANQFRVPVAVMAGGVNVVGACIPEKDGIVIDLRRMDKIIEINTDSGYAVVEPGVNFDRYTAALAEKGFRTAIPTAPGGATPLGNYLSRPSGSLANKHLDLVQDLEVVLADGTIINTGSSQFPNVGSQLRYGPFPDMAGLFLCSYGTLGVVTRAALKIYPMNEANRVHLAAFDRFDNAVDFVKDIINNNIPEHCIIWNWQLYKAFEVNLVNNVYNIPDEIRLDPRKAPEGLPYVIVTTFMSGYEEAMRSNETILERVALKYAGRALTKEEAQTIVPGSPGWDMLYGEYRPVEPTFFGLGKYLAWIVLTEPEKVKELEKWAVDQLAEFKTSPVCYYSQPFDFGRAMFFRIFCFPDPKNQELVDHVVEKYRDMYQIAMKRYGGVPMRVKSGFPTLGLVEGYGEALTRIKRVFDPNNILSPHMGIFEEVSQ